MINLHGSYTHNVDTKGRLSLPAKFRKKLPEGAGLIVVVEPLEKQCLYVFDEEGYDEYIDSLFENLGGFNRANKEHRELRTQMSEYADDVEIDSVGRIGLSARLADIVGINDECGKEVQIIGNYGYFEIWNTKRREEARNAVNLADLLQANA